MTGVVAGHADNGLRAEHGACLSIGRILLADVDAITTGITGQVRAVVHDKSNIPRLCDGGENFRGLANGAVIDVLKP